MEWTQAVFIVFGNVAWILPFFVWSRSEARADARHTDARIEAIQQEIKDFHGRLCAIEERRNRILMGER
jgi:hypothetical protein